jgi:phage FluMu protein Com
MTETFTEIRCPACVGLGWYSSHLLLRVRGEIMPQAVKVEMKCPRCKSVVVWDYAQPKFEVIIHGIKNKHDK